MLESAVYELMLDVVAPWLPDQLWPPVCSMIDVYTAVMFAPVDAVLRAFGMLGVTMIDAILAIVAGIVYIVAAVVAVRRGWKGWW